MEAETVTLKITRLMAEEIAHKMHILADEPELQGDYGITQLEADRLADSVPHWLLGDADRPKEWTFPKNFGPAVHGEMMDHCKILDDNAHDASESCETQQARDIRNLATRIRKMLATQLLPHIPPPAPEPGFDWPVEAGMGGAQRGATR
jgi:hypothetical protein